MEQKTTVIGAGGFIGGHLVTKLKQMGRFVIGIDIKEHEYKETDADEFIIADMRNPELVDKSIDDFLNKNKDNINLEELSNKIFMSQSNKIFILYNIKEKDFSIDIINNDELSGIYYLDKNKNNLVNKIIYETKSGKNNIHMLLRWKNHAGILYPGPPFPSALPAEAFLDSGSPP